MGDDTEGLLRSSIVGQAALAQIDRLNETLDAVRDALHDFDISTEEREGEEPPTHAAILDALTIFVVRVRYVVTA